MIDKPATVIAKADIDRLVESGRIEDRTIEYKRDLPGTNDEERREFLRDISSFANAQGGDILYGIEEVAGVPTAAPGVVVSDFDELRLRLQNMIHSNLDPRLPAVEIAPVTGFTSGSVVLIRVHQSWRAPHMITFNHLSKFYMRGNGQKHEMDVHELRAAFVGTESIAERIRSFRDGRFVQILTGQSAVKNLGLPTLVVHVLPIGTAFSRTDIDARRIGTNWMILNREREAFPTVYAAADRANLDGLLIHSPSYIERFSASPSYIQVFRNGGVEFTSAFHGYGAERLAPPSGIDLPYVEAQILDSTRNAFAFREAVTGGSAALVSVALLQVNGLRVDGGGRTMVTSDAAFDRDVVVLPDILFDTPVDSDLPRALQLLFDSLWQAAGFLRSRSYSEDGSYIRKSLR